MAEQEAISATKNYEEVVPLYADKKKAAFMLWREPNSPAKYIDFLKADTKILDYAIRGVKANVKAVSMDKTYYHNDIWLAVVATGTYLLTYDPVHSVATRNAFTCWIMIAYWVLLVVGLMWIAYRALSNSDSIKRAKDTKIKAMKSDLKHTEDYRKEIEETIASTKKQYKIS